MTLASTPPIVTYLENGSTVTFAVPFQFIASADLVVTRIDPSDQRFLLTLGADYNVSGGTGGTGTVTMTLAKAAGWSLEIKRFTARTQPLDLTPGDTFPAESIESAFSRGIAIAQEIEAELLALPAGDLSTELAAAQLAAQRSEAAESAALVSQTAAQVSAGSAAVSASASSLSAAAAQGFGKRLFAAAADGVSKGVVGTSGLVAGSGGTNGQFDVAFSGGAGSGAAARFTVAGGVLTSIIVTAAGIGYTSAPTMSFAASTGLTGASATAVIGGNTAPGEYFWVSTASGLELYKNVAGVATDQSKAYPTLQAVTDEDTRALLGSLPRGAIGVWPFDRYDGTIIPNLIDGSSNIVTTAGNTLVAGVFTGNGTITFGAAQALSNWTVSCLVQVTGINSYNSILYDGDAQNNFAFRSVSTTGGANTGGPGWVQNFDVMRVGISAGNFQGQRGGLMNLVGKGYHVLTMRQDATGITYWIDDVKLYNNIGAILGALNITHLTFSKSPDTLASQHTYAGFLGLWDRGLSDAEVRQAVYAQRARVAPNAIYPSERSDRIFIAEGDSNHGPFDANSWVWQFGANDSPENFGGSYAISGSTVSDLVGRASLVDAILPPDTLGRKFLLSVGILTNDLPSYTSTTAVMANALLPLRAYMTARKTAGWKLALFTIPKRGDSPVNGLANFETNRLFANADILANPTLYGLTGVGQVIDIGSATGIGSTFDSTKYAGDLLHFSATGGAQVEALARAVINAS